VRDGETVDAPHFDDRQTLDLAGKQTPERITEEPDLVVPEWTLCTVRAEQVEFWQGDKQRRHTRLRYERHGDVWTRGQLWA
jgi:pyridoxamine 5'-phosphate oxidase